MQTSLRNSYHYYDYGTLDCTTRQLQHIPEHSPSDHTQLPTQQLQHQHSAIHQHELIHHVPLVRDTSFDQRDSATDRSLNCFALIEPQNNETGRQPEDPGEGQLVVYDHHTQQQYQLMNPPSHLQQHQSLHHLDNNLSHDQDNEDIYNHNPNHLQQPHHPQQVAIAAESTVSGTSQEQLETQVATAYPTIYYEPINFTESCAIEQHHATTEPPQTFASHMLVAPQFVSLQQPSGSTEEGCTYFQYIQDVGDEQHRKENTLPDNQEGQSYDGQPLTIASCEQQHQVYQTLEISGNHTAFRASPHNQTLDHTYQHQVGGIELGDVAEIQSQHEYQQLESKKSNEYHLNTGCYINSESTGASTTRSQGSPAYSDSSSDSTLTRDEKRAREANIPLTYYQIVNLSIDQFNEQLAKHNLTESQLTLIKDIRRRGKNKVAAQSCRKRKMEQIYELQHEVNQLADRKRSLSSECNQLMKEHNNLVQKYNKIYPIIHCFNKDTWNS